MKTATKPKRRCIHRSNKPDTASILTVLKVVTGVCQVPGSSLIRKTPGQQAINHARHLAIHALYAYVPGIVHEQIGEIFHRHCSGVTKSTERHAILIASNPQYRRLEKQIRTLLAP